MVMVMDLKARRIDALKLIADWSKWVVTIETLSIGVIGTFMKGSGAGVAKYGAAACVVLFVVSIICAAFALLSLPASVEEISDGEQDKVWNRVCMVGPHTSRLWKVVAAQFLLFVLGIVVFGMVVAVGLVLG